MEESEAIANKLIERCLDKDCTAVTADNAFSFIKTGIELVSKLTHISGPDRKLVLIAAIERIAKGSDGIVGTGDDILAPETLNMLEVLIEHNIVSPLIEVLLDAAKGRLNLCAVKDVVVDAAEIGIGCMKWRLARNHKVNV